MTKKPTGLAGFTRRGARQPEQEAGAATGRKKKTPRGLGETVALTVRIPRAEWMRLHHLALSESTTLQNLAVEGFNLVLAEHGLPSMRLEDTAS